MVKAHEMEDAVQHEDLDLLAEGVAELLALIVCAFDGDGALADAEGSIYSGKGEHVCREIVLQKGFVQAVQFAIIREQALKGFALRHRGGKFAGEAVQQALIGSVEFKFCGQRSEEHGTTIR